MLGVIEPGRAGRRGARTRVCKIGVLATAGTIASGAYPRAVCALLDARRDHRPGRAAPRAARRRRVDRGRGAAPRRAALPRAARARRRRRRRARVHALSAPLRRSSRPRRARCIGPHVRVVDSAHAIGARTCARSSARGAWRERLTGRGGGSICSSPTCRRRSPRLRRGSSAAKRRASSRSISERDRWHAKLPHERVGHHRHATARRGTQRRGNQRIPAVEARPGCCSRDSHAHFLAPFPPVPLSSGRGSLGRGVGVGHRRCVQLGFDRARRDSPDLRRERLRSRGLRAARRRHAGHRHRLLRAARARADEPREPRERDRVGPDRRVRGDQVQDGR